MIYLLRPWPVFFAVALCVAGGGRCRADVPVEEMRRLYDFTPVGPGNPVVARVKDSGIEIPVSELRAYVAGEVPDNAARAALSLADKRRYLENLLDDHLLLWDGYQRKADQTEGVAAMLRSAEAMLLEEALTEQEIAAKGKSPEENADLRTELRDQIFDRTDITVSNEAYAKLKAEALRLDSTAQAMEVLGRPGAAKDGESGDPEPAGPNSPEVRDLPLARCKVATITIGDFLQAYTQIPALQRPDLKKPEGVITVLKQMLEPSLMVAEARARGLNRSPMVREKMQLNRNVLTRLYALDQLTARAAAEMQSPGIEARVRQWYGANLKNRYTVKDKDGKDQVLSFEADKQHIMDDYFEDLQERMRAEQIHAWREGHKIERDEAALAKAVL